MYKIVFDWSLAIENCLKNFYADNYLKTFSFIQWLFHSSTWENPKNSQFSCLYRHEKILNMWKLSTWFDACLLALVSVNSICDLFDKESRHLFMVSLPEFWCNHRCWNQTNFVYWRRKITQWHENQTEFNLRCFRHMFHLKLDFFSLPLSAFSISLWWNYFDICCEQIELKARKDRKIECAFHALFHDMLAWEMLEKC